MRHDHSIMGGWRGWAAIFFGVLFGIDLLLVAGCAELDDGVERSSLWQQLSSRKRGTGSRTSTGSAARTTAPATAVRTNDTNLAKGSRVAAKPPLPERRTQAKQDATQVSIPEPSVTKKEEPKDWRSVITFGLWKPDKGRGDAAVSRAVGETKGEGGGAGNEAPTKSSIPVATKPAVPVAMKHEATNGVMRLRSGLILNISVLVAGKKEIDETAKRISDGGTLNLPMLGIVPVQDESTDSLAGMLTKRYAEFFVNPQVIVDIVHDDYREGVWPWGYVTVLGRVKKPGRIGIPATRDLTITRAIQQAGGFDTSAKDTAIRLTRRKADGRVEIREVNLKEVGASGRIENDLELMAEDVIFVPELMF